MSGSKTSATRIHRRLRLDEQATREAEYPWVRNYRRNPGQWIDLEDANTASRLLREVNLNRWSPEIRDLIRDAREAASAAIRAMGEVVYR